MKSMKRFFCLLMLAMLSLALLTGCGRKWNDTDDIDGYGTVTRNGQQTDVYICHDQKTIYLHYNDEEHKLFDTAGLPDEIADSSTPWHMTDVSFEDWNDDGSSDLRVSFYHADMSESCVVWTWEGDEGLVYQWADSRLYASIVVRDPPEDELMLELSGTWYFDGDLSANTYIVIDDYGDWSYYERASGEAEGAEMDCGIIYRSEDEAGVFYAYSTLYDDVNFRVDELETGVLLWDEEYTYYRMD